MNWQDADNWNLVSAGPSREHLRKEHLLDGPVVTVNRAIDIVERGIEVHFAAFADGPAGCWQKCDLEKYWRPGMQILVTLRPTQQKVPKHLLDERARELKDDVTIPGPPIAYLWDLVLPASVGIRFMPTGSIKDQDSGKMRHAFTTLCALKRIADFKPKRVRILCADMSGPWIAGMTEAECDSHDQEKMGLKRWLHEKPALEAEIKRMRKDGTEVEELRPEPMPVEVGT